MLETPAMERFRSLNNYEQYVFLLQTYCTKYPFDDSYYALYYYEILLRSMAGSKPGGQYIKDQYIQSGGLFSVEAVLLHHLRFFGWCALEESLESKGRHEDSVTAVIPNAFGVRVFEFLTEKALPLWNVDTSGEKMKRYSIKTDEAAEQECFLVFQELLSSDRVVQTVSYPGNLDRSGIYHIKVSLSRKCWRTFTAAHYHTLDHLHIAIQKAFEFDDDHLYAFYIGGNHKTGTPIYCEDMDELHFDTTSSVTLEDLGLYPEQRLYYLFDFGDRWEFEVDVLKIDPRNITGVVPIQVTQAKGDPPQQYSWFEDAFDMTE